MEGSLRGFKGLKGVEKETLKTACTICVSIKNRTLDFTKLKEVNESAGTERLHFLLLS